MTMTRGGLLGALSRGLRFPRYFGRNWDALDECLRDLAWLDGVERVAVVHEGMPFSPRGELWETYLAILHEAAVDRASRGVRPSLVAVFSNRMQSEEL